MSESGAQDPAPQPGPDRSPPAPAPPASGAPSGELPGAGFFGWLGRQFGHIRQAIHAEVDRTDSKTVWRDSRMEEQASAADPRVKLRRTVIDEVIVSEPPPKIEKTPPNG